MGWGERGSVSALLLAGLSVSTGGWGSHTGYALPQAGGQPPSPSFPGMAAPPHTHCLSTRRPEMDVEAAHRAWSCTHPILGKEASEAITGH